MVATFTTTTSRRSRTIRLSLIAIVALALNFVAGFGQFAHAEPAGPTYSGYVQTSVQLQADVTNSKSFCDGQQRFTLYVYYSAFGYGAAAYMWYDANNVEQAGSFDQRDGYTYIYDGLRFKSQSGNFDHINVEYFSPQWVQC